MNGAGDLPIEGVLRAILDKATITADGWIFLGRSDLNTPLLREAFVCGVSSTLGRWFLFLGRDHDYRPAFCYSPEGDAQILPVVGCDQDHLRVLLGRLNHHFFVN